MWRPGQKIGDYELLAQLREGGMATLFLAKLSGASGFTRHVAIKVIHPDLAEDEQFRHMFLDEALLSSRIQHPNVVHVEELGQHEGMHFLVMEFVHGCSLAQLQRALLARGRRLSPAFAARIAMHVADALHAAHETRDEHGRLLEVVHRDVTPENILLAYSGHVKLIDFGIAKAYGRRHRTQDGLLKGKFRYMAPEQALGKSVDRRVDLYQLGIVLWEMLTLRRLFDAELDVDLLQSVQHPRVQAPSAVVGRVPPALDAVVMAALSENARQRPPDAQTFARALAKAIPAAHDVDSGALRTLLLAAMQEQRQRDRVTYPPGLYDRLDQQVDTLPLAGAEPRAEAAKTVFMRHTVEHTSPYGSDALQEEPATKPAASSKPPRVGGRGLFRQRRPRQLVRFAEEWRTVLTRAVRESFVGRRVFWLAVGGALGLAGALALITLSLRSEPHVAKHRPPALPRFVQTIQRASRELVQAPREQAGDVSSSHAALVRVAERVAEPSVAPMLDAGARTHEPPTRNSKSQPREAARAAGLVVIDGTPLATEPGF